jgi:hypothetical protein
MRTMYFFARVDLMRALPLGTLPRTRFVTAASAFAAPAPAAWAVIGTPAIESNAKALAQTTAITRRNSSSALRFSHPPSQCERLGSNFSRLRADLIRRKSAKTPFFSSIGLFNTAL